MSLFSRLFQGPVNYVDHKVDEVRGEVRAELAKALASVSIYLILGVAALLAIIFLSISLAIGIALWTGIYYLGFLIMGIIYGIAAWMFVRLSKNEEYMEKLRDRFRVILEPPIREEDDTETRAYENDL